MAEQASLTGGQGIRNVTVGNRHEALCRRFWKVPQIRLNGAAALAVLYVLSVRRSSVVSKRLSSVSLVCAGSDASHFGLGIRPLCDARLQTMGNHVRPENNAASSIRVLT